MGNGVVKILSAKDLDDLATIEDVETLLRGFRLLNDFNNKCWLNKGLSKEKIVKARDRAMKELDFLKKMHQASDQDGMRLENVILSMAASYLMLVSQKK